MNTPRDPLANLSWLAFLPIANAALIGRDMTKSEILKEFEEFTIGNSGGITNWLTKNTDDEVFRRLAEI